MLFCVPLPHLRPIGYSVEQLQQLVQDLLDTLPEPTVVVVYIRGRLFYLNEVSDRYVIAANNPITLVGNVADGAYVVAGDRPMLNQ